MIRNKVNESLEVAYTSNLNKNKGITLIALIITIVILLILAGIGIQSLTQNGLFDRAKQAKTETMIGKYKEEVNIIIMQAQTEKYIDNKEEALINIVDRKIEEQKWCRTIERYSKVGEKISSTLEGEKSSAGDKIVEIAELIVTTTDNYEIGIKALGEKVEIEYVVYGKMKRYTITYNANDGTGSTITQSIAEGKKAILKENPFTREKYTFVGWIESEESETIYQSGAEYPEEGIKEDKTLYARWEKDIVKIIYNVNDGTGNKQEVEVGKNTRVQLTGNEVTRQDYRLIGWATEPEGNIVYGTNDIVEINTSDVILYAKWEKIIYHLWDTYSVNDPSYYTEKYYGESKPQDVILGGSQYIYPEMWLDTKTGAWKGESSKGVPINQAYKYGGCIGWYYTGDQTHDSGRYKQLWQVVDSSGRITPYKYVYKVEQPLKRGDSLNKQAKSENRNAYPDDGASGSIWYVYIGTNE